MIIARGVMGSLSGSLNCYWLSAERDGNQTLPSDYWFRDTLLHYDPGFQPAIFSAGVRQCSTGGMFQQPGRGCKQAAQHCHHHGG